jgi:hypothetical protein
MFGKKKLASFLYHNLIFKTFIVSAANWIDLLDVLIQKGVALDEQDVDGNTALMFGIIRLI